MPLELVWASSTRVSIIQSRLNVHNRISPETISSVLNVQYDRSAPTSFWVKERSVPIDCRHDECSGLWRMVDRRDAGFYVIVRKICTGNVSQMIMYKMKKPPVLHSLYTAVSFMHGNSEWTAPLCQITEKH